MAHLGYRPTGASGTLHLALIRLARKGANWSVIRGDADCDPSVGRLPTAPTECGPSIDVEHRTWIARLLPVQELVLASGDCFDELLRDIWSGGCDRDPIAQAAGLGGRFGWTACTVLGYERFVVAPVWLEVVAEKPPNVAGNFVAELVQAILGAWSQAVSNREPPHVDVVNRRGERVTLAELNTLAEAYEEADRLEIERLKLPFNEWCEAHGLDAKWVLRNVDSDRRTDCNSNHLSAPQPPDVFAFTQTLCELLPRYGRIAIQPLFHEQLFTESFADNTGQSLNLQGQLESTLNQLQRTDVGYIAAEVNFEGHWGVMVWRFTRFSIEPLPAEVARAVVHRVPSLIREKTDVDLVVDASAGVGATS